jgi:competence ComEA-like helix-hairpin-helix protein
MQEKVRGESTRGSRVGQDAQTRGLLVLIAGALLAAGAIQAVLSLREPVRIEAREFVYENVGVIVPIFVEQGPVNVNTDGLEALVRLHGIGEALAARIIADRQENGPFSSLDELDRVSGIGPDTINGLRDHATVGNSDQ